MAATGGGKIRTRRYHIVSKPYAKGKQQPGLISRVTDTVKSIVPSWLQKYFKNGELTEGGEARVEVEQNNVAPPPNGNEETVPLRHGRNSPEPSTSNAEPSTSRASLNFQDALSRPPLNRSHLHFPSQDGSPALGGSNSLFSQPSTSTAPFPASPFAVASNFSLVKEIKDSSSQHEDDNISTTSGFSSRASDKDVPTSKTAPLLWSPETERTHSGSQPAQHSLKKPAFNLSVFGTSSSSAMNSSVLNSSQLGDSPFYQGKTTYGGAAAARTARARPGTPYQAPVRRQIKAKPAGAQPCGVTSATARRILQSLERMSSPLADAKRIPSTVSSPLSTLNHPDPDVSPFQSKKKKLEPALPPVQKLVIPTAAAVTGNRSMSFRPSLTPGSVSRTVEKSVKETPVRSPKIPDAPSVPPSSTSSLSYPLSSTPATSSTGAGGGKMKRERSVRPSSKKPDDEVGEVPKLPAISLPISNFTLPTFSFSSPPSTSSHTPSSKPLTSVPEEPLVRKEASPVSMAPVLPFIFSSPIVKATAASPTSFSPSSGFTFSAPTMKTAPSASNGNPGTTVAVKAAASEGNEEFEGPFKPAKALKQGSVLDILKGPGFASPAQSSSVPDKTLCTASEGASSNSLSGFKPASESRNCDASIVQNKPSDKESVACLAPRPNTEFSSKLDNKPTKAPTASLTTLFAPPPGSWECDTCLVRNKPEVIKCVACDTAKPGTGVKPTLTLPPASEVSSIICAPSSSATTTISISTTSGPLGFGDKFKKPEGAWDCDVCMVQNKAQDIKCVACQNAKPGTTAVAPSSLAPPPKTASTGSLLGFGDKFKKPEGSWDCDVCCVQNKAEDQQCVACQSAKPGAKVASKDFGSSFGTQSSSTESTSSSFKFGTSSSNTASSGLKFGGTFSNSSNSVGFQMGNNSSDSTTSSAGFKFGASSSDASGGFKFGGALTEPASTGTGSSGGFKFDGSSDGFKFGTASAPVSTSEESSSTGFKFGGSSGVSIGSGAASTSTTVSGGFSFGLSKPEEKAAPNSTFSFSAPKVKGDKDDGPSSAETVSAASTTSTAVTNTIPVFGKPSVVEPATAAPSFGETAAKEPATPAFTFGKPEEKKDNSTPSTGFVFSAAKEADKPAPSMGFSFSKPEPPKEIPKPTFTFGKLAESTETPKPAFGFGQNATDTAAPKPAFGFMANSSSTPASSSPAPSLFGAQSSSTSAPTSAPNSTFVFGQTSSSDAPPAKTFMFGQQQDSQPASAGLPAAPAPTQPFLFGSAANSATFSFGAAAATTPASAAPAPSATPSPFVFTSATSSSGFGFGQTPAFGQGSSQTSAPAFGSAAPSFSATASPAPAFGAKPSAAPAFGQQPNSTPVFGSSTASAGQGGFQFGGASAFGTSARNSSEFTFGASGTAANSASSQSMSAQPVAPGGGFNFTQAPAFNIGSTKNSFSPAPTGQHAIPGRKIKTAVRRRK